MQRAGGGAGSGVDGFRRGGLFWALLLAIIHLSLGDRLINVAFLQLTSKVTGIVGAHPLLFATAPEEGNGHIICSPRGFSPISPYFLYPYYIEISGCLFIAVLGLTLLSKFNLSTIAFSLFPLPEYFNTCNLECNQKQGNGRHFMLLHVERKGGEQPWEGILEQPLKLGKHKYIIDTHRKAFSLSVCQAKVKACKWSCSTSIETWQCCTSSCASLSLHGPGKMREPGGGRERPYGLKRIWPIA